MHDDVRAEREGLLQVGEAKVLSTTRRAPACLATCATAAMSVMPSSGLDGVSTQIALVRGVSAARTAATSEVSATENSTPHREATFANSRNVPP